MTFEPVYKGKWQYTGKVNGKTYVVNHSKVSFHTCKGTPSGITGANEYPHDVVTSREHIAQHNTNLTPEEIDMVHKHIKDIHKPTEKLTEALRKKQEPNPFKVGDKVQLHPEALKHHAQSVPAHMGYSREGFAWRKRLGELEGKTGTVSRVFDSGETNVDYHDGTIGIHHKSLIPAKSMNEDTDGFDKPHHNVTAQHHGDKVKIIGMHYPEGFMKKAVRHYEVETSRDGYNKVAARLKRMHGNTTRGAEALYHHYHPGILKENVSQNELTEEKKFDFYHSPYLLFHVLQKRANLCTDSFF